MVLQNTDHEEIRGGGSGRVMSVELIAGWATCYAGGNALLLLKNNELRTGLSGCVDGESWDND